MPSIQAATPFRIYQGHYTAPAVNVPRRQTRIYAQNERVSTQDSFQFNVPTIRQLDPHKLKQSASHLSSLTEGLGPVSPKKLSLDFHHQQLNRLLNGTRIDKFAPNSQDLRQIITDWRKQNAPQKIDFGASISQQKEAIENKQKQAYLQAIQSPTVAPLKQRVLKRIDAALSQIRQRVDAASTPRLKKLGQLFITGIEQFKSNFEGPPKLKHTRAALTVIVLLDAIQSLGNKDGRQSHRLQTWALSLEDIFINKKALTFQDILDVTQEFVPLQAQLQQNPLVSDLLQHMNAFGASPWLQENTSAELFKMIDTLDEMTPTEFLQAKNLVEIIQGALQSKVGPALLDYESTLKIQLADQANLAEEVNALIKKADELALRELAPKPEAPREFPNGVLSLIQYFKEVLTQLEKDQAQIIEEQLLITLQQRKQDNQIIAKLLEGQRHYQQTQEQQERLINEALRRYQEIETSLFT